MTRNRKYLLILTAFVFMQMSGIQANAQVLDTVFPSTEKSRFLLLEQLYELDTTSVLEDTTHDFGHRLHPLQRSAVSYIDCGLPGSPALAFGLTSGPVRGFDAGIHVMDPSFFQSDSIRLYRSPVPKSFLKYGQGHNELIYVEAQHSQNIFDRWNFGLNYRRIKAQNWYYDNVQGLTLARMPDNFNFSAYSRFYTANRKYEAVVTYVWNKASVVETGGIINTSRFDTTDRREKELFNSGYLADASNVFKENEVTLTQFFRFGKSSIEVRENPDTLGMFDTSKVFTPKGHFFHQVSFRNEYVHFTDDLPNMNYYPPRLFDVSTNDSFVTNKLTNRAGIFLLPSEKAPRLEISADHEWIAIDQSGLLEDDINQLWLNGKVTQKLFGQMARFSGKYGVIGYNSGDFHLTADLNLHNKDTARQMSVTGHAAYSRYRPSYMQNFFVSNHYLWFNSFEKSGYTTAALGIQYLHHIKLEGAFERFDNPVLFNTDGLPKQFVSVQVVSATASNRLDFWRFHLKSELLLKVVPDNSPMRFPLFSAKESFYYEGPFFKGNMLARLGVDLYYNSAFKANYYNPVTRQFQIQDSLTIGNMPVLDFFFTAKIRTVDIFALYRHGSAGWFGNNYYASPRHPQTSSGIRFGLSWRLFN